MRKSQFFPLLLLSLLIMPVQGKTSSSALQFKNSTQSAIYALYANLDCEQLRQIINSPQRYQPLADSTTGADCGLNPYVDSFYDFQAQGITGSSIRLTLSINNEDGPGRIRYAQLIQLAHGDGPMAEIKSIASEYSGPASSSAKRSQSRTQQLLMSLVYGWTAMLDRVDSAADISHLVASSPLDFRLVDGTFHSKSELVHWLGQRRKLLNHSLHRIENLKINQISANRFRIRFDYDYRDRDRLGQAGLARLGVEWLVIMAPGKPPVIKSVAEQYLPPRLKSISNIEC